MSFLWRWLKRGVLALLVALLLLALPVIRNETMCRGTPQPQDHTPIVSQTRDESRTFTTYPEWHIVHAYADYARVIASGDPDDFRFLQAIGGFWSSLCPLTEMADAHGGFTSESKATIYTIGVSFTLELMLKAAYEETLGRVATWLRGPDHSPIDRLSAQQAADYAAFLQQTPWYRWDFTTDAQALDDAATGVFRDRERQFALGVEYRAKAAYARAIAGAVAATGQDELTLRAVVTGLPEPQLATIPGVTVIQRRPEGFEIETPRYRELTTILQHITDEGGQIIEIAGNDDILLTAITNGPADLGAIFTFPLQGSREMRHLIVVKVPELASRLRELDLAHARLEHIHDY
ncbi:hypothetical protein [Paracoccus zhejiangensis]|uniref:Uncharacterized protein n=1 Tax=Paracoccus zhejiangensis TaxID=1077935 RepID=A0A2H5F1F1_9RHOB|nr:hypothetical protein [Paracoccus zhejiangensis]AUH65374.1 hypothetical protein CX676_15360 [Paracoccus zhejiangensis]